jgi:hypothetical protein
MAQGAGRGEAHIDMTALYQSRAGGNRAMIANAERLLVLSGASTARRRAALQAPWDKESTRRFLGGGEAAAPGSARAPCDAAALLGLRESPTSAGSQGSRGSDPVPGWKKAWEQAQARKKQARVAERDADERHERQISHVSLSRELERADIISCLRDELNVELLRIAERVAAEDSSPGGDSPSCGGGNLVSGKRGNNVDGATERRAAELQRIASSLGLFA